MEEYKFGDWSSGRKQRAEISLNVRKAIPTEHPIIVERVYTPRPEAQIDITPLTVPEVTTEKDEVTTTSSPDMITTSSPGIIWTEIPTDSNMEEKEMRGLSAVVNEEVGWFRCFSWPIYQTSIRSQGPGVQLSESVSVPAFSLS